MTFSCESTHQVGLLLALHRIRPQGQGDRLGRGAAGAARAAAAQLEPGQGLLQLALHLCQPALEWGKPGWVRLSPFLLRFKSDYDRLSRMVKAP